MKLFTAGAAMSLLLLTACGGAAPDAKSIADAAPKTSADSLSYYEGMALATVYQQMSGQDSTLKTDASKAEAVKAFAAALKQFEGKSDAEITGIIMAVQAIMQNKQMNEDFDLKFNTSLISTGLAYAMSADSLMQSPAAQQYLMTTFQRLQAQKMEKDTKAAQALMAGYAKKGYTKVSDDLYTKVVKAGNGAQLKDGDRVKVNMTGKDAAGKPLSLPMPNEITVGQMFQGTPMAAAMTRMKVGETAEFVVPVAAMFQNGAKQLGLEPGSVVVLNIEVTGMADEKPAAANAPAAAKAPAAKTAEKAPAAK